MAFVEAVEGVESSDSEVLSGYPPMQHHCFRLIMIRSDPAMSFSFNSRNEVTSFRKVLRGPRRPYQLLGLQPVLLIAIYHIFIWRRDEFIFKLLPSHGRL